jgi:hypothetical protein
VYTMHPVCDEMWSTQGSFYTVVQNINAHIMRMFDSYQNTVWLLRQETDTTSVISDYTDSDRKQPKKTRMLYTLLFLFKIPPLRC